MKKRDRRMISILALAAVALVGSGVAWAAMSGVIADARNPFHWEPHDPERPSPPTVEPGEGIADPPADAVVLFDGTGLDMWRMEDGRDAQWRVEDGVMIVEPGTGNLWTRDAFGDCQLYIEWMTPPQEGEERIGSNSGVFFGGDRYEVQVIDSSSDQFAPDQRAGGIYGQYPPQVNVTRPRGEWQTYQIIYRRPRFDENANLLLPATMTVLQNGVLVQYHETLTGPTAHQRRPPYEAHGRAPIMLQDHNDPVSFRNIWIRELE